MGRDGSQPLGTVKFAEVPVERAEREMACFAGDFEYETVGESK